MVTELNCDFLYQQKHKALYAVSTPRLLSMQAITVMVLFWMGHSSVMRMHTAMHSPSMEQPAGWATLHKTTTVQSATVTISGSEITGSALTATTTETQAAGTAADSISSQQAASQATAVATAAAANSSSRLTSSLAHMLGDLQHSLHAMLTAHAGWKPGDKITRAQLAAAAAASVPDDGRDIELHAHKVAEVVGGAKVAQQLQRLAQGGVAALLDDGQDELTSAEAFAVSPAELQTAPQATNAIGSLTTAVEQQHQSKPVVRPCLHGCMSPTFDSSCCTDSSQYLAFNMLPCPVCCYFAFRACMVPVAVGSHSLLLVTWPPALRGPLPLVQHK